MFSQLICTPESLKANSWLCHCTWHHQSTRGNRRWKEYSSSCMSPVLCLATVPVASATEQSCKTGQNSSQPVPTFPSSSFINRGTEQTTTGEKITWETMKQIKPWSVSAQATFSRSLCTEITVKRKTGRCNWKLYSTWVCPLSPAPKMVGSSLQGA